MGKNTNSLNWFEVPANDIALAAQFYEFIFAFKMEPLEDIMGMKMVSFPNDPTSGKTNGALVKSDLHKPSKEGSMIYLNANPSIQIVLNRIEKAGGKIVTPKTQITPEIGYMAFFIGTEGNKIGLHVQN